MSNHATWTQSKEYTKQTGYMFSENCQNSNAGTPLHLAIKRGHEEAVN